MVSKATESRELVEVVEVGPGLVGEPEGGGVGGLGRGKARAPGQQEAVVLPPDAVVVLHDLAAQQERKQQLVLLEQASAHVCKE